MSKVEERIIDNGYEDVVVFANDEYRDALIGVSTDNRAVYDYDMMIGWLVGTDGCTEEEAIEYIEYNTIRSLPYVENSPIIVRRFYDDWR